MSVVNVPRTLMERMAAAENRIKELERQVRELMPARPVPESLKQGAPPLMVVPRPTKNWIHPFLLDTGAKVKWANRALPDRYTPWKLGDACPIEPPKELDDDGYSR